MEISVEEWAALLEQSKAPRSRSKNPRKSNIREEGEKEEEKEEKEKEEEAVEVKMEERANKRARDVEEEEKVNLKSPAAKRQRKEIKEDGILPNNSSTKKKDEKVKKGEKEKKENSGDGHSTEWSSYVPGANLAELVLIIEKSLSYLEKMKTNLAIELAEVNSKLSLIPSLEAKSFQLLKEKAAVEEQRDKIKKMFMEEHLNLANELQEAIKNMDEENISRLYLELPKAKHLNDLEAPSPLPLFFISLS